MGLKPAKKDDLNPKEKLFLKYYTDVNSETFGNGVRSALRVWTNQQYESADVTARQTLEKTRIKVSHILELKGLSTGKLAEKIDEWLSAKKIKGSMTEPDKIVEDYQTQLKAGEMLVKLLGLETQNQPQVAVQINNVVNKLKDQYDI
ncbi:MAG: hypothetical protein WC286_04710 [Bacilli bacterium]|jgi:hypothetical protein